MKKIYFLAPLILLFFLIIRTLFFSVQAEEDCNLLCLETKIKDLSHQLELSQAATKPLEETLNKLEIDIKSIQNQIIVLENGIVNKENELENLNSEIAKGDKELLGKQDLLSSRVRSLYIRSQLFSPFVLLLSKIQSSALIRELSFRESVTQKDKDEIIKTALFLKDIENKKNQAEILKAELEDETTRLASAKANIDKQAEFFRKEVTGAKSFQSSLSTNIASLTARQQEILSAKTGLFSTSVGDVPLADDPASRPDYNPGFSPAFAAFSFGAPHFKGMSQYGAYGRAMSNQNEEDIIKAYYGDVHIEKKDDLSGAIDTTVGTLDFENNYLMGLAEMPSSWDANNLAALKAQAIAARSYAIVHGKPICVDEGCQVYLSSKAENPPDNWRKAVEETRGKVIVSNQSGQIISAWYASTSGGYQESYSTNGHNTPGFWDTKSGRSGWTSQAYEKISGSPWFYKAWYKDRNHDSCERSHPWLTSEEMADILNAWVVLFQGGGDSSRITPISSCWGGNPYSMEELRSIGGYTSVSDVSVIYSDAGITSSVTFQTNKGSTSSINGLDFKKAFNLRAPGRISLMSGLYNVEKK